MTRSLLQPIRTRRVVPSGNPHPSAMTENGSTLTPGTRKTLAAIGALWVSFAITASAGGAGRDVPGALATAGAPER